MARLPISQSHRQAIVIPIHHQIQNFARYFHPVPACAAWSWHFNAPQAGHGFAVDPDQDAVRGALEVQEDRAGVGVGAGQRLVDLVGAAGERRGRLGDEAGRRAAWRGS